jgi:hypothetical protein
VIAIVYWVMASPCFVVNKTAAGVSTTAFS